MELLGRGPAPLMGAIPVLHLLGLLTFPLLLALAFAYGAFVAPYFGSQRALLAELVGDEALLGEATALLQAATRLTLVIGPAIAGVLIGAIGATSLLFVDAATYLFSFVVVATLVRGGAAAAPEHDGAPEPARGHPLRRGRPAAAALDGRDRRHRRVLEIVLFASLPVLVLTQYGGRPELLGWLFGGFGAGLPRRAAPSRSGSSARRDKLLLAGLAILAQGAAVAASAACPGGGARRGARALRASSTRS